MLGSKFSSLRLMPSQTATLLWLVQWEERSLWWYNSAHGALPPQGAEVQTDYMPLLNSLAAYGWQLTCVLPTPILKTTR